MTHPLTPPPELVQQWIKECDRPDDPRWQEYEQDIATRAATWGANQELEAIIELAEASSLPEKDRYFDGLTVASLRAVRRPKPPSLKKQALSDLKNAYNADMIDDTTFENIHRALEALSDD